MTIREMCYMNGIEAFPAQVCCQRGWQSGINNKFQHNKSGCQRQSNNSAGIG